jgi:hypothetical protein
MITYVFDTTRDGHQNEYISREPPGRDGKPVAVLPLLVGGRNGNCFGGQRSIISHDERQSSSMVHQPKVHIHFGRLGPRSIVTCGIRHCIAMGALPLAVAGWTDLLLMH